MHVLIPYALGDEPAAREALRQVRLPRLQALLQRLSPKNTETLPEDSLVSAHERMQAQARGLDPQAPAWAALRAHELGLPGAGTTAWAFLTPSHWEPGQARVTLRDPQALDLREDESRALLEAMRPYFLEDGIALHHDSSLHWLACGEPLRNLATALPERVIGRDVAPWLPASPLLRRLQNEMQMLLYTHPVTDARAQRGVLAVNSFWLGGSGTLAAPPAPATNLDVRENLVSAAIRRDWSAWAAAWQVLDTGLHDVQQALDAGTDVSLTLCSELSARHYRLAPRGLLAKLRERLRPASLSDILAVA